MVVRIPALVPSPSSSPGEISGGQSLRFRQAWERVLSQSKSRVKSIPGEDQPNTFGKSRKISEHTWPESEQVYLVRTDPIPSARAGTCTIIQTGGKTPVS